MKTWKLVAGVLSMVLFVLVAFQSCAVGLSNSLADNQEIGGSAGIIVSVLLLTGGIVSVATKNSTGIGGNIALIVLFGLGALFGFSMAGSFIDLKLWAGWCLINALLAVIGLMTSPRKN